MVWFVFSYAFLSIFCLVALGLSGLCLVFLCVFLFVFVYIFAIVLLIFLVFVICFVYFLGILVSLSHCSS